MLTYSVNGTFFTQFIPNFPLGITMERVTSKHLFNYQLNGVMDKEVEEEQMKVMPKLMEFMKSIGIDPATYDPEKLTCEEAISNRCKIVDFLTGYTTSHASLINAVEKCIHTKFEVPPRDGNDYSVPVLVHTPKRLESRRDNPAIIHAHGGGVVMGSAELVKPALSRDADSFGVVYFNVDYRLAPETKCPNNALDFYCAVKHIVENAKEFGIDPTRIAIAGDSGGSYIAMATMVMMAQKDEGNLVKLAILAIPMIDDSCFGDPKSMTREERQEYKDMRKIWECIAVDIDEQRKNGDPLLFPAKADDELLAKMPPTIIWEVELDMFITEATRLARRLRAAGRLLELYIAPGVPHGADFDPDLKVSQRKTKDYKLAIETYLL